jgi:hypothetical protein
MYYKIAQDFIGNHVGDQESENTISMIPRLEIPKNF